MHILTAERRRVELVELGATLEVDEGRLVVRAAQMDDPRGKLSKAALAFFGLGGTGARLTARTAVQKEPPVGVFREKDSGLIRMVHKELVIRFATNCTAARQKQILEKARFTVRCRNAFMRGQYVVKCNKATTRSGPELVAAANDLMDLEEVIFATPNFVSEFKRAAIPVAQWHLKNIASVTGQKLGEDVDAEGAWAITRGSSQVAVAILDDGVDIEHPNLRSRLKKDPDPSEPRDKFGRDFFIPDDEHPEHFNPRPKMFQFPYDQMAGNDIHGTPCAGVVVAAGNDAFGIAPGCKFLPVKVFHADNLASDARVADAIRYAAFHADVLSCSWSAGTSPDIESAINDDAALGREGRGTPVFCATGNDFASPVSFPANLSAAIAIGASTDQARIASYSNVGKEVWVVAPSNGGKQGIYTTDVSIPNRGFNVGNDSQGGADGLHTNDFGGTSSATPLAAGVAALMLSANPNLTRQQIREILAAAADKIGTGYDAAGHSNEFGFGRVNAAKAVKAAKDLL